MINDIVNGISNAIYEKYGQQCRIYTENVEQGLKEPCFFIAVLKANQARIIGNRYKLTVSLDVHYFPATKAKNKEINEVAQALYAALMQIKLINGDMLNGLDLHWEAVEDVLHFFVTYKPVVTDKAAAETTMEALTVDVKGGE